MTSSTDTPQAAGQPPAGPEALRQRALAALLAARERTALLTDCVEGPDLTAQHSPAD
ncbi:iron(II)-dependent oxidoreductase, partial [Streptomyces sp. IgraMP-1]